MKNQTKGFVVPLVLVILTLVAAAGFAYESRKGSVSLPTTPVYNVYTMSTSSSPMGSYCAPGGMCGVATSTVVISGMQQYTDSNFGFSFWYPSEWQVQNVGPLNASYGDGVVQRAIRVGNGADYVTIEEIHSPDMSVYVGNDYYGYDTYYFDTVTHTWMNSIHLAANGSPDRTVSADVSQNTMGGLHTLFGGARFGGSTLIPISAQNFIMVTSWNPGNFDQRPLAQTIVALDPSVATPVSQAQQMQTIQAEATAYGASAASSTAGWQTYTDSQYGFSFQYPTNLGSSYASINGQPQLLISSPSGSNKTIDNNGCYVPSIYSSGPQQAYKPTQITLNGISFCESNSLSPGAGSLEGDYYFTTLQKGTYITIGYGIGTSNGCGAVEGTPKYAACQAFGQNYDSIVFEPLEQSAGTLKFTN